MEPVYVGWLIKSPPAKRIWRAKWRRRWFVLRQSGQIPGQYLLEYYTDSTCKKLKGKIDLDQCNQVDAGLTFENTKWNYQFMFDIQTPKRIYLLVAETDSEMNKWVECICQVCGLKIDSEEDQPSVTSSIQLTVVNQPFTTNGVLTSNDDEPITDDGRDSPTGPYIPISECVSGKNLTDNCIIKHHLDEVPPIPTHTTTQKHRKMSGDFYDYPRLLHPPGLEDTQSLPDTNTEELYKFPRETSSVPQDDGSSSPKVNWETYPGASNLRETLEHIRIGRNTTGRKTSCEIYENVAVRRDSVSDNETEKHIPPRPPKPPHLVDLTTYQNCGNKLVPAPSLTVTNTNSYDIPNGEALKRVVLQPNAGTLDEMYDFPRPLVDDGLNAKPPPPSNAATATLPRRHAYSNAPAGYMHDNVFTYDNRTLVGESYLNMDLQRKESEVYTDMGGEVHSPVPIYTNLSSPNSLSGGSLLPPVHRDLKPPRKGSAGQGAVSRSCSSASSTDMSGKSPSPVEGLVPPQVNRELKPKRPQEGSRQSKLILDNPPVCRIKPSNMKRSFRKPRATPSPTSVTTMLPNNTRNRLHSSSDDDQSSSGGSRRNSANEEPRIQCVFNFATMSNRREAEIQYLDLDLESDLLLTPKSPERTSASTVYKTVDFVKTKAFNETRQNVEETYRKSQN
uniref:PH domain-containing protein n=1 Tax=Strigamia maritima TaxID=126957 RepID=T1IV16_STRMM